MVGEIKIQVAGKSSASPDRIMDQISDWQRLPEFWHGMRSITRSDGSMLLVRFAFPGNGKMSYLCDRKSLTCTENYHSGPFSGFKKTELRCIDGGTEIRVRWEIKLSLSMVLLKGFLARHFTDGTESAIRRICESAESDLLREREIIVHQQA